MAKITPKQLCEMDLHQTIFTEYDTAISRVIGGWVYRLTDNTAVFVPLPNGLPERLLDEIDNSVSKMQPGQPHITDDQWAKALANLNKAIQSYGEHKDLQVVKYALRSLTGMKSRYDYGERTNVLWSAMMSVEPCFIVR